MAYAKLISSTQIDTNAPRKATINGRLVVGDLPEAYLNSQGFYMLDASATEPAASEGYHTEKRYAYDDAEAPTKVVVSWVEVEDPPEPEQVDMKSVRTFDQLKRIVGTLVGAATALLLCVLPAGAQTMFGHIDETNQLYTAQETDRAIAAVLAGDTNHTATVEALRLVVGDLWRRVDALDGADGSGYVTAAEVESIYAESAEAVAGRIYDEISTNQVSFRIAQDAIKQMGDLNAHFAALAPTSVNSLIITSTAAQSIPLSQTRATRRYRTGAPSALTISSFTGLSQTPCWLVLSGYSTVNWPSGAVVLSGAYESGKVNYFRVCRVHEKTFIEKVHAQ